MLLGKHSPDHKERCSNWCLNWVLWNILPTIIDREWKKYIILYTLLFVGDSYPFKLLLLAGATEPQIPGQPDTRTVSSPRQSTLWTVKCSLHYALKICTFFFIFICYHLHPSTSLHLFLFYSILSSIPQLYTAIELSIFGLIYI